MISISLTNKKYKVVKNWILLLLFFLLQIKYFLLIKIQESKTTIYLKYTDQWSIDFVTDKKIIKIGQKTPVKSYNSWNSILRCPGEIVLNAHTAR